MNVILNDKNTVYYHREYKNDVSRIKDDKSYIILSKRIGLVALPFISLYKPLGFTISAGMGTLRLFTSLSNVKILLKNDDTNWKDQTYQLLQMTIAVTALVSTIFMHPIGMIVTTGQDILIEIRELVANIQKGEKRKIFENCLNIINNSFYLALTLKGGLEIAIISLSFQCLIGLIASLKEYKKGNYLEAVGQLLMVSVRCNQLNSQLKILQLKRNFEASVTESKTVRSTKALSTKASINSAESNPIQNSSTQQTKNEMILTISNKLRGILSEQELLTVIQSLQYDKIPDPYYLIQSFAALRGEKNIFSTSEIHTIIDAFSPYSSNWKDLEKSDEFWKMLSVFTFGSSEKTFQDENEHLNYEFRRFITVIKLKTATVNLLSPSIVRDQLQKGLLLQDEGFKRKEENFWRTAHQYGYEQVKIFHNESWQENFDISYQTKSFQNELEKIPKMGERINSELVALATRFPKNHTINLSGFHNLKSHAMAQALSWNNKYLKDLTIWCCGYVNSDGESDYYAVDSDVLRLITHCKELRMVKITIPPSWFWIRENVRETIKKSCPLVTSLTIDT
ncbi:MAG: hypothetical protein H0W88_11395 [Parachlamydiaceae bacterium]|nr:hypothetical protein [Parachlamydiaceae bacterium]